MAKLLSISNTANMNGIKTLKGNLIVGINL